MKRARYWRRSSVLGGSTSLVLFFLVYGRRRRGVLAMVAIGMIAIAVSAPWWIEVTRLHGLGPFMAAGGTGESILTPGSGRRGAIGRLPRLGTVATGEPLFPAIGVLAVLGGLAIAGCQYRARRSRTCSFLAPVVAPAAIR